MVSARCRLSARLSNLTANSTGGGHAQLRGGGDVRAERQAGSEHEGQPRRHRPPAQRPWLIFHNSTVVVVRMPSTINGQIAAVVSSAPKRRRTRARAGRRRTPRQQRTAPTPCGPVEPGMPWHSRSTPPAVRRSRQCRSRRKQTPGTIPPAHVEPARGGSQFRTPRTSARRLAAWSIQ